MPIRPKHIILAILAIAVPAGLTGCGGARPVTPTYRVEDVAHEIAEARRDDTMRLYAASVLSDADLTLDQARASGDPAQQRHLAYIAQRKVDIARSTSGLMAARESIAHLPDRPVSPARKDSARRDPDIHANDRHATPPQGARLATADPAYGAQRKNVHGSHDRDRNRPVTVIELSEFATDVTDWQKSLAIESRLQPILRYMRQNPHARILVEAFLRDQGNEDEVLARSLALAESVKNYLASKTIDGERVLTLGSRNEPGKADFTDIESKTPNTDRIEISLFAR